MRHLCRRLQSSLPRCDPSQGRSGRPPGRSQTFLEKEEEKMREIVFLVHVGLIILFICQITGRCSDLVEG